MWLTNMLASWELRADAGEGPSCLLCPCVGQWRLNDQPLDVGNGLLARNPWMLTLLYSLHELQRQFTLGW